MCTAQSAARTVLSGHIFAPAATVSSALGSIGTQASCHHFHSSSQLAARRPRFRNITAREMGLIKPQLSRDERAKQQFPEYTGQDKEALRKRYSPEQMAAVEAAEASIGARDLNRQGRIRVDPYRLPYIDDFRTIQPIIDKRPRTKPPPDPNAKFMDELEFSEDLAKWATEKLEKIESEEIKKLAEFAPAEYQAIPESEWPAEVKAEADVRYSEWVEQTKEEDGQPVPEDLDDLSETAMMKYWYERSSMTGGSDKGLQTAMAPALPKKVPGVAGLYSTAMDPEDKGLDDTGIYQDLKRQTGLSVRQIFKITYKPLVTRYVSNQTRLGKIRSASIMVIAGNRNGWLGLGVAKSIEPQTALQKARILAIRDMKPIPRYENRTIYGNVEAKVGASVVKMYTRPPGT